VGGKNLVPMAELRTLFESLDCTSVATYVQSGNVVFSHQKPPTASLLSDAIHERFGIRTSVVLRDRHSLESVVELNPFSGADPVTVHVGFMEHDPGPHAVSDLDPSVYAPDRFVLLGREVYLHLPRGMARAKLPSHLDRRLPGPVTFRNWNTVSRLVELAGGQHPGTGS